MSLHDAPIYLKKNSVQRIAVTATGAATAIREDLRGPGWVRVKAVGADVQCYFGLTGDTVTLNETSSVAAQGWDILDGQAEDFLLTSETHLVWDATAAGYVVLMKTNKPVGQ